MKKVLLNCFSPKQEIFFLLQRSLIGKWLFQCFLLVCLLVLTVSISFAQSPQSYAWKNVAIGGGGFVSSIITGKTQQGHMYARTDVGGAYRWDAGNKRWIPLLDWVSESETGYLGVESLAIDHQNPNRLYMLVGISYFNGGKTALLRSDDYGDSFSIIDVSTQFKAHGNGMGRQTGEKLVVDPNKSNILFTGTRWNGLFKSSDYGSSWTRLNGLGVTTTPNENGISFVVLDPSSSSQGDATKTMFVGVSRTGTNFYRSDDGGVSFTAVTGAPTDFMPHRAALASDGNLYITYGNGAGPHGHWAVDEPMDAGQLWKYNTRTGSWTNVTPSGYTKAFAGISVDPGNPQRLVASTVNTYLPQDNNAYGDRIFLSTNGGSSWTDLFEGGMEMDTDGAFWVQNSSIHWTGSIEFDPFNTQKVWVTSGNGIFSTDNISASPNVWKFQAHGVEETVPIDLVSIPNGPTVSVILDYDGFMHTDLSQYAPVHSPRMGSTRGLAYAAQNPDVMLRAGEQLFYSTDMGASWIESSSKMGIQGSVAISADGDIFLHAPEESTTTYRSTNRGSSWTTVSGLSISDAKPVADFVNPDKFYAYNPGTGAIMVSTNGGASFSAAGSAGSGGSKIIRTVPGKEGHIWVALNGGGLTRSTNSGQSFSKINTVDAVGAVGFGKAAEGSNYPTVYIWGTVNGIVGIHRSTDEGASWVRVNDDAHEYGGPGNGQFVVGDMNVFGRVYMSTAGRGIVYGEMQGTIDPVPPVSDEPVAEKGTILREYWTSINGSQLSALTGHSSYPSNPSGTEYLSSLEEPSNWGDNYGSRIRGYVYPPRSGSYTFWIAGDDDSELFISTDESPANASRVAYINGWTSERQWTKYASQKSVSINLVEGKRYYIEVLHKEGGGGDNLAVAWEGPGLSQQVIAGQYLAPYSTGASAKSLGKATTEGKALETQTSNKVSIYPNPVENSSFTVLLGSEGRETATMQLLDLQGRLILETSITHGQVVVVPRLKTGMYLVQLSGPWGKLMRKLKVN